MKVFFPSLVVDAAPFWRSFSMTSGRYADFGDQPTFLGVVGIDDPVLINERLELVGRDVARLFDTGFELAPHVVEEQLRLLAVLGTHLVQDERLDEGLVLADPGHLHADAVFLERVGVERRFAVEAGNLHFPERVHVDRVRHGGQIVVARGRAHQIGRDRFLGLLEGRQRLADFLESGKTRPVTGRLKGTLEVDADDAVILGGAADGVEHLAQGNGVGILAAENLPQRLLLLGGGRRVGDIHRHVDDEVGALVDLGFLARAHAGEADSDGDENHDHGDRKKHQGEEGGEDGFEEAFHDGRSAPGTFPGAGL